VAKRALSYRRLTSNSIIDDSSNAGHTFNDLRWFSTLKRFKEPEVFNVSNGGKVVIEFGGEVRVKLKCSNGSYVPFVLQARYSPQAPCNLISNGQLAADRVFVDGRKNQLILSNGREVAQRKWIDGVAVLTPQHQPDSIPSEVQNVAFATVAFRTHTPESRELRGRETRGNPRSGRTILEHTFSCGKGEITGIGRGSRG